MDLKELLKSSGVQLQPKEQHRTYVIGELMESEWESEMDRYVKQELERASGFPRLLLFWMSVPFVILMMSLWLLMAAFVTFAMSVKDSVVGLTRLCWVHFCLGLKKLQGIFQK